MIVAFDKLSSRYDKSVKIGSYPDIEKRPRKRSSSHFDLVDARTVAKCVLVSSSGYRLNISDHDIPVQRIYYQD